MTDFHQAMLDPTRIFSSPDAVVDTDDLEINQKIKILEQWEYDQQELAVADDENMGGEGEADLLDRIHDLLLELKGQGHV